MGDVQPLQPESPPLAAPEDEGKKLRRAKVQAETAKLVAETKALTSFWVRLVEALKSIGAVAAAILAGYAALTTYRVTQLETTIAAKEKAEVEAKLTAVRAELKGANDAVVAADKVAAAKKTEAINAESEKKKAQDQLTAIEVKLVQDQEKVRLAEGRLGDVRKQVANNPSIPEPARTAIRESLNGVSATLGGAKANAHDIHQTGDVWKAVEKFSSTPEATARREDNQILQQGYDQLTMAHQKVGASLKDFGQTGGGDYHKDLAQRRISFNLGVPLLTYSSAGAATYTKYEIKILDGYVVFSHSLVIPSPPPLKVFYKTPVASPVYGDEFAQAVRRSMEPQIQAELTRKDPAPSTTP